ncbi:MAG: HD domain-containing protein [Candidatus Marinimicrobia bacterium]|nr:HD domain-containing protein [Candidatus Neomarinimicrobiota bacterium]
MKRNIPLSIIRTFKANEEIRAYLLLKEKHLRLTRDGKPYLDVILSDRSGTIIGKIWEHAGDIEPIIEIGAPVGVRAIVEEYRGNRQLNIKRIVPVNEEDFASKGFSWELILPQSKKNSDKLWIFIEKSVAKVNNPYLIKLLQLLIIKNQSKILKHPASLRLHHATMGGFLEHMSYMLNLGIHAAKQYKLDQDLVITGILLHDIGKLDELSGYPNNLYTDEGNFLGHVAMGYNMTDKAIEQIPDFPAELALKVKHILLSHQGEYKNQSPKKPVFPEALLIHYLDELDARMDMMKTAINQELDDGEWTSLKNYFRVPLYKSQKDENESTGKPDKTITKKKS